MDAYNLDSSSVWAKDILSPVTNSPMTDSPIKDSPVIDSAIDEATGEESHDNRFTPLVAVVDFHHARGPEIENWFGASPGSDPAIENDWSLLPFMALSDGAHASIQEFSYFTLLRKANTSQPVTSLFGISCSRQIDSSKLINRPDDVTRSTVQKAVVVITDSPQSFGMLRERLSVVTTAWFSQNNFKDTEILKRFQESLREEKERSTSEEIGERDDYSGLSLRELVRQFRWQTLVLFKCCLLQPKMLFFSSKCERLCLIQFSLISLIPGLIRNLQTCADPELYPSTLESVKSSSLKASDRASLLKYMGLPLQIFGKGSLFGPYTPLQQLDILADFGTKSYIVGSTNSLLLQQRDRYSDILINLDEDTINISSSSLRSALALTVADRRWIDCITQSVNDTWDESNHSRPKNMGYVGSQEFIRLQFEEYLVSLLASVKYHNYLMENTGDSSTTLPKVEGDPSSDYGVEWIDLWTRSENYKIWDRCTDNRIFDIVEPKHPCTGSLTIEDVKARMMDQVKEFHLDERFAVGKEILGRNLQAGKEKANVIFNKLYADMEALRETQRRKLEESRLESQRNVGAGAISLDINAARLTAQSMGSKAGAFIGSWGSWMEEKRKTGWGRSLSSQPTAGDNLNPQKQQEGHHYNETESITNKKTFVEAFFDADNPLSPEDNLSPISPLKYGSISSNASNSQVEK
ncbi:Late secretory pathway protein AVL9 [Erysiphe neolycopersici]|uniref:Late secretory pathway protein AVL9 n=1 Tax=Erysiphe neolycopersici TaxID=212602 RepID=A0A420HGQ9_9PEZI|nr:Late secretory pathway protein AVL9 [Erysiphe neolycopersici]